MNVLENVDSSFSPPSFLAVLVLVDVSDHWTRNSLSKEVLKCLSQFPHIPSVLVLNKVNPACFSAFFRHHLASAVMGFGVPGLLKDTGLPLCSRILRGVCVPVACTSTPEVVLLSGV